MNRSIFNLQIRSKLWTVLLLFVLAINTQVMYAQNSAKWKVTGVVTSKTDGLPLIGVSVMQAGTSNGTITDFDGCYTIEVPAHSALHFTYMGYKPYDVQLKQAGTINVIMTEDTQALEEVVVIGYGVQKKKLSTGATAQLKGDDIAKRNTTNPLQAMQGQTPGVSIMSTSGQPGADLKVTVRGLGTVGDASPLYLIDGVGGDISTLNPADIESIDVLKDAASAAIYGAQAANGVVLITTKHGKAGRTQVSFDAYYGLQNVAEKVDMLNASQYKMIMDEQSVNDGSTAYDWDSMSGITNADGTPANSDWIDKMFKDDAVIQNYTIGFSGGTEKSTYSISLGYFQQEGIVGGEDVSNYERYNFRVNSEHKFFGDFMKVGEHASYVYKKNTGVQVGDQYSNTLRGAFNTSPLSPIYSDNNTYDSPYNDTTNSGWYKGDGNPYGLMMTDVNNLTRTSTFAADVYAELHPIKNMTLRTVLAVNKSNSDYRYYQPLYHFSPYSYNDTATNVSQNTSSGMTLTSTNTASYNFDVNKHHFVALIGMESSRYSGDYLGGNRKYLKSMFNNWGHAYINNTEATAADDMNIEGYPYDDVRTTSYFSRLSWNLKETYMATATIRADGSSKFSSDNRWGYFPSISAGWVISNEAFMESTKSWLDFLKLRVSWGQVGNQNISSFQYVAPVKTSTTNYIFGTSLGADYNIWGAYPSRLANEDITWETSEQTNIGLDATLFNRLRVNADFYIKTTKDWLVEAPILATAGTGAPYINGGDVKNTGFELGLNWNDTYKGVHYNISVNGAYNKNEVGNIPTEDGIIHGALNALYDNSSEFYRAQNGHAIGYFWGFKTCGIFQNQEEIDAWNSDGKHGILQPNPQPGDVKYVDQNQDGVIDEDDKIDLGNGMPDFTYGFNISLDYKHFDFALTANGVIGNDIVQTYRNQPNAYANYTTAILQRWTGEGTSNRIPRVTSSNINYQFSDLFIQDGDYLRISNITLGYDFASLLKCPYISQARLYAQVQNAFTFTKYDGMDPEIGYGNNSWVSGVDLGYYPRPRTVLFGVNLKF